MDHHLNMSRRELLFRCILGGAVMSYGGLRAYQRLSSWAEQMDSFTHIRLPAHFEHNGFTVLSGRRLQSDRQVLFLLEHAGENTMSQDASWGFHEAEIIDYLVGNHKADSLGLYAIYGPSSPDMDGLVQAEFEKEFSGINKYFALRRGYRSSRIEKYLSQEIIPCYGIEDKDAYFRSRAIEGFDRALFNLYLINKAPGLDGKGLDLHDKCEQAMERLRKKFPDINFPQCPIDEMASLDPPQEVYDYHTYKFDVMVTERNMAMASNIHASMDRLGSRRGIVLVKYMHSLAERGIRPLQDCVAYASSMIDVPSRNMDLYDPFFIPNPVLSNNPKPVHS